MSARASTGRALVRKNRHLRIPDMANISSSGQIRVVLVDDHRVVRLGLRSMLELDSGIRIVGEAGSVAEAMRQVDLHRPDIVVLDWRLPDGNGVSLCGDLKAQYPDTRRLILTSYPDESIAVDAILRGAAGYVIKDINRSDFVKAIKSVARGEMVLPPFVIQHIVRHLRGGEAREVLVPRLSAQQRRVLDLVANGLTNKEIGEELGLSEKTVRNYLYRLYKNWGVKGRTHATSVFLNHIAARDVRP